MGEPEGFGEFVALRSPALLRTAWLLTGDWASAQDLVQEALIRTWSRWSRVRRRDAPEVYVRKVMLSTYLSWRRRRSHGEVPIERLPDVAEARDEFGEADLRQVVQSALAALAPRQRAVVVLRFFDDLTEAQAADTLGCSVGTVKSQSSKALAHLRAHPDLAGVMSEEVTR
jgi:RNA polymerase sigma-70 factor (sigma-E family)